MLKQEKIKSHVQMSDENFTLNWHAYTTLLFDLRDILRFSCTKISSFAKNVGYGGRYSATGHVQFCVCVCVCVCVCCLCQCVRVCVCPSPQTTHGHTKRTH